jgi:hypothetical protein
MDQSSKTIINFIEQCAEKYNGTSYRYEFNKQLKSHFVEVEPSKFYYDDEAFALAQFEFVNRFIDEFPIETVSFISKDSLYKISEPIFEKLAKPAEHNSKIIEKLLGEITPEEQDETDRRMLQEAQLEDELLGLKYNIKATDPLTGEELTISE